MVFASNPQRVFLITALVLALAYAGATTVVHKTVSTADPPMYDYHSSRGVFEGTKIEDRWIVGPAATSFPAGSSVLWQTWIDVVPGVTESAEATLWCNNRPVFAEDGHVLSKDVRVGWRTIGMIIPRDVQGDCEIRRHAQFISPDGAQVIERDFKPAFHFTVTPAPPLPAPAP